MSVSREQACRRIDAGDANEALVYAPDLALFAVLAEQQVLAIRRVGDAGAAAVRIAGRFERLQDQAGLGVEDLDGLAVGPRRAHDHDGRGAIAEGVDRDRLGADADPEVDLGAGGREDRAVTGDKGAVRLRANLVGWERYRLTQERRNAERRRHQADEQTRVVHPKTILRSLSRHGLFSFFGYFHHAIRDRPRDMRKTKRADAVSSIAGDGAAGE